METTIEKLAIPDISAVSLEGEKDKALLNLHRHLHGLWAKKRKDPKSVDVSLEDIWNAHKLVVADMKRRKFEHGSPLSGQKLPQRKGKEINTSIAQEEDMEGLGWVNPSGNKVGREIKLEEVLEHVKSFKMRQPFIYLTGGLVNNGKTKGDIEFLVKGKLAPGMLKIIQFRLGRMLPKELSNRVHLLTDDFDGPFTNNIPLGDLMFRVNNKLSILRMSEDGYSDEDFILSEEELAEDPLHIEYYYDIQKQDPLMQYPKDAGKRRAAVQMHFRGKSAHGDFRFDIGKELVGWTAFMQRAGKVPDIDTVAEGNAIIANYDMNKGNKFLKPVLAPAGLQFIPKKAQPMEWLTVHGVIEPGEIGATAAEEGVYVTVEDSKKFRVEWGIQKPHFHEYFLTNGKTINGTLFVRLLAAAGFERVGRGPTFWRGFVSKTYLPSIINKRSVKTQTMPPDGISAMPLSLMKQTPREFRFWEHKGKKARDIRDALVKSGYFTDKNIELVNNEYKRVEKKSIVLNIRDVTKREVPFIFQYQSWKGQFVERVGPTKEQWVFYFVTKPSGKVPAFIMERDPQKNPKLAATREMRDRGFLELEGEIKPSTLGNPTKNTPSWIDVVDKGKITLFEDSPGFIKFESKLKHLKGLWTLTQEEPGSAIWKVEFQKKKAPVTKGIMPDEEIFPTLKVDFKPLIKFKPLKPRGGFNRGEFFDVDKLIENWAATIFRGKGRVIVNPKWNGFRTVAQKKGDDVLIFFEDTPDVNRAPIMPKVTAELKKIKGDFILDAELIEYEDREKKTIVNRKDLARWAAADEPLDDSNLILRVFGILYWNKSLLREPLDEITELTDKKIKGFKHLEPTEHWEARNEKELRDAIGKAEIVPGSEGAMVKLWKMTYTLGGRTSSMVKYKIPRMVNAIILGRHKVKGTKRTFNYTGGIGPIKEEDKDKYANVQELEGKFYVVVGQTFNTNLQGNKGDIVTVTASEVFVEDKDGKEHIAWFIPIVTGMNEVKKPDSVAHVRKLGLGEGPVVKYGSFEKYVPICKVDKEERMVYGIVLEPNTVDAQGDLVSEEEIRLACHKFMEFYQKIGYQHKSFKKKFRIMECYIAPVEFILNGQTIRKGTWMLSVRVVDDDTWKEVKDGKITGFSIGGYGKRIRRKVA